MQCSTGHEMFLKEKKDLMKTFRENINENLCFFWQTKCKKIVYDYQTNYH